MLKQIQTGNISISNANAGIINIYSGEIKSPGTTIVNNGRLNIYGGTITNESTTISQAIKNSGIMEMMRRRDNNECFN